MDLKLLRNELVFGTATVLVGVLAIVGLTYVIHVYAATTITVCDTGCDYTTITDAITIGTPAPGDTIAVGADYASTTETFPFNVPTGVNLDCQNSGAIIGVDDETSPVNIHPQSDNIFRDCIYSNVSINSNNQSNIQILDNQFLENSHISTNNVTDIIASGNTNLKGVNIGNTVGAIIDSNTINSLSYAAGNALLISNSTSVQFTRNIITDYVTSTPTGDQIIGITNRNFDIYFASNTVSMPFSTFSGGGLSVVEVTTSLNVTIRDNVFSMSANGGGIQVLNLNGSGGDIAVDTQYNTILLNDPCNDCSGILMSSWDVAHVWATSSHNLIIATSPSSTASMQGHSSYGAGPASSLDLFTDYEGFVGLNIKGTTDFPASSNSIIRHFSPLRTNDATSTNDYQLVPYSVFLDVNGTDDIGAIPGVRGNSFHVNQSGTVDYSLVDATNTTPLMESLRSGDTVHIANGDYSAILLSLQTDGSPFSGNVTIVGAGAGTIIHATSSDALFLSGINSSNFSDMTFTGASSTPTSTYTITQTDFVFGGNAYDQSANVGGPPNSPLIIGNTTCSSVAFASADNTDVTFAAGQGLDDWSVGMVEATGGPTTRITIIIPSRLLIEAGFTNDAAGLNSYIATKCGAPNTVDAFIAGVFTANGDGTFSYSAANVAAALVTVKPGLTLPPALTRVVLAGAKAGIRIDDSTGEVFTNVTSTGNSNGFRFVGVTGGNIFTNSALFQNLVADILGESSGDNTLINTSLSATSASMTNNGVVRAFFTMRGYVQDNASAPVSGANVTFTSNNGASSTLLITDATGFTLFTATPFPAFVLSSSTNAETAGGYNPYTIHVDAVSGFGAATILSNLRLPNQTFSISLAPGTSISAGGGGGAGGLPSTNPLPATGFATSSLPPSVAGTVNAINVFKSFGWQVHDLVKLPDDQNFDTQEDSTVYYLGADGMRHAFSNSKVFFSWYCDFSKVRIVTPTDLAQVPLGKNITYRSGIRLVKFPKNALVYLVQPGALLRPIASESDAMILAGSDWNRQVEDISEAFFDDYAIGEPLSAFEISQKSRLELSATFPSGNLRIQDYLDPGFVSGANICSVAPEIWPFTLIPKTYSFTSNLNSGMTGSDSVRYLQELLTLLGKTIYPEGKMTGSYGVATQAAVKRFQKSHGLPVTGTVGPATRAVLNAILNVYR